MTTENYGLTAEIAADLHKKFDASEEKQRPAGKGGMMVTYIDARAVMDRLDAVVGACNWETTFTLLGTGTSGIAVECRLTILGVTKADVGEADREDEPYKSAYSDAFKRAAVHFGIGRYLYRIGPGAQHNGSGAPSGQRMQQAQAMPARDEPQRQASRPAAPVQRRDDDRSVPSATEPQIKAIYAIARGTLALDDEELDARCKERYGNLPQALTRRQASEFIDALKLAVAGTTS